MDKCLGMCLFPKVLIPSLWLFTHPEGRKGMSISVMVTNVMGRRRSWNPTPWRGGGVEDAHLTQSSQVGDQSCLEGMLHGHMWNYVVNDQPKGALGGVL